MFLLDTVQKILVYAFLITAMLSVGLQTTPGDLRSFLRSKGFLLRTLLANFVAVPIVGILLAKTLPFTPEAATALLLLACTPGGVSALQFTSRIKGAALFAGSSSFLLAFVAVFLSPALVALVLPGDISVVIPYGRALLFVVLFLLLPLVAGKLVRSRDEHLAEKLVKPCAIISALLFFVVLVLLMGLKKEAMSAVGKETLLYMLIFIVISMAVGWVMGGPAKETRTVLATVTAMRHVALSLFIALNAFPGPEVQTPLLAFSVLMIPPNMLFTVYMVIRSKKAARGS
jgi:BASS family bile acid:Na+ symporter